MYVSKRLLTYKIKRWVSSDSCSFYQFFEQMRASAEPLILCHMLKTAPCSAAAAVLCSSYVEMDFIGLNYQR